MQYFFLLFYAGMETVVLPVSMYRLNRNIESCENDFNFTERVENHVKCGILRSLGIKM